tara:strand:- start:1897 stop:2361 length:465 start_codon:yes stop_codon:yes gene_type:complete
MVSKFIKLFWIVFLVITILNPATPTCAHMHENQTLEAYHAVLNADHLISFLSIGILVALLLAVRKPVPIVILANGALLIALLYEIFLHSVNQTFLVRLEFFVGAAFLVLIAWRITYLVNKCFYVRIVTYQPHLSPQPLKAKSFSSSKNKSTPIR